MNSRLKTCQRLRDVVVAYEAWKENGDGADHIRSGRSVDQCVSSTS